MQNSQKQNYWIKGQRQFEEFFFFLIGCYQLAVPIDCPNSYSFQESTIEPKHFILVEKKNGLFCLEKVSYIDFFSLIGGELLYNIVVAFAIHSHESAMGIHVFPILNTPPTSLPIPSLCTSPEHPVSCIKPGLAICFTFDNIHVSMLFSQIISPSPSPTESKSLFFTTVSLLLSRIQGHRYHLSKFHIYVLIYCIGVFLTQTFVM